MFGKIIIAEVFVPTKYKTIKPVSELGGFAGGMFFIISSRSTKSERERERKIPTENK
jgi:hypothetical protein